MTAPVIAARRLHSQRLAGRPIGAVEDVVRHFGAVQAQDYAAAAWALSLRTAGPTRAAIDAAFDRGAILRTHVLRPTWHFVAPADVRWMLELSRARLEAASAQLNRSLGLDGPAFDRALAALTAALEGGRHLTRVEIARAFRAAGIDPGGPRLSQLLIRAERDGLVCSGPLRGRQFTWALLEERVPPARRLERAEALGELARRYMRSHGPAQAIDLAWWAGLTVRDARAGLEAAGSALEREVVDGKTYWSVDLEGLSGPDRTATAVDPKALPGGAADADDTAGAPTIHLLPSFDEYVVAYRDRSAVIGASMAAADAATLLSNVVVLDGRIVGTWRRALEADHVRISADVRADLGADGRAALSREAQRFGRFLGMPVELEGT